jgi:hypothetical protein
MKNHSGYSAGPFSVDEIGFIQIAPATVLAAVARGEIDLNKIAREELASRGRGLNGEWVGFQKAQVIHGVNQQTKGESDEKGKSEKQTIHISGSEEATLCGKPITCSTLWAKKSSPTKEHPGLCQKCYALFAKAETDDPAHKAKRKAANPDAEMPTGTG